jgi:type VI secretion system FHA domain protein
MGLTLRPVGSGAIVDEAGEVTMSGGVLTIGRGEDNDLVLPDPDRHISKRHCVVEERGGDYFLIDLSTNGTFLNHSADRVGETAMPLSPGDVITLGRYELQVRIEDGAPAPAARDPLDDLPPPLEQTSISKGLGSARPQEPNEALEDPLAGDDDLLGLLDGPAGGGRSTAGASHLPEDPLAGGAEPFGSGADPLGPGGDPLGPGADPFGPTRDPLADEGAALGGRGSGLGGDPFGGGSGGLMPGDPDPLSLDPAEDDAGGQGARGDHAASTEAYYKPPRATNELIPDDFDEEIGLAPKKEQAAPAPPKARTPEPPAPEPPAAAPNEPSAEVEDPFGGPLEPVAPEADPPAARGPAAARPAPKPEPARAAQRAPRSDEAAWAFLRAAGAEDIPVSDEELVETMERLGTAFRTMVEGLREVLMTRKSIKDEFRMSQTQIQAGGNNPLKFSVSPEQAIEAMVRPRMRGYLRADEAADGALKDIRAHEVAVISGMEAALKAVLARLDPEALAGRIESGGGLSSLLSGKKARYWEVYEKLYGEIAREAEDDFHALFGREFARAYEEQLRKL